MTYSPDDVTDAMVARCEHEHHEFHYQCAVCPSREDERRCGYCGEQILGDACENCTDEPPLITDGFGAAIAVDGEIHMTIADVTALAQQRILHLAGQS